MIKIQINNPDQRKQDYLNTILDRVAFRVSILRKSLSHLNGSVINFNGNDFRSFKAVTKEIITIVGDVVNIPNGRIAYSNAINGYRGTANNLATINLNGLIQFCDDMLANNNLQLSGLLICEASNLLNLNDTILDDYGLNTTENISIIKLAFDYKRYNEDIASPIKQYFRINEFVKFCPYCNTKPAYQNVNAVGEVVDSYELDHFYDKASYPLLSYSLFNLIPSDHTCNVINKGTNTFEDEYHINPHLSGYTNTINFIPIGLNPSYEVKQIELNILEPQGSVLYKKINGNNPPLIEQGALGNLNVFKIRSKHLNEKHLARTILKTLETNNSYRKHLRKHLQRLVGLDIKDSYINWYEKELNVRFNPLNFNDKAYSKFHRDIHDFYYLNSRNITNEYIIELIEQYND